ncbi:helix-turn-helix transcriptional regulator [Parahaliea sp. F7430]|uniref:Helix-turn-helix transcriptional regulator n=1 Tax=Sediminihaliea albiluteola TaxID=2758564 RepID=A0A7W2TVM6_9GAMM|nr:helix-turn-helix transcriptional regulator [Sediminihaliea albiluteola]MBA6412736.1 helix-turn-helix transcriptional regulator [Sediminihaliea albiluteola]
MTRSYTISEPMNALLLALSRGPVADPPWEEFLRLLGEALDADYVTLILRAPREGDAGVVINSVELSSEIYDSYNETYFAIDPFVNLPAGEVFTIEEFMSAEAYYASDYYQQYVKSTGIRYLMGADLGDDLGNSARLRFARLAAKENFSTYQQALCRQLLPHIQQTLRLQARIARVESERALFATAVDRMAMAAFILDQNARIRHSNRAAEALLAQKGWMQSEDGQLRLVDRRDNAAFRACLDDVMQAHLRGEPSFIRALRLGTAGGPGIGMLMRPLPLAAAPDGSRNPSVAIFVSDPAQPRETQSDILMTLFGFTPAEAKLALQLANGASLDEACRALNISRNTAKSHLSAVFAKTGVTRQTGLVQLILRSVAHLGD